MQYCATASGWTRTPATPSNVRPSGPASCSRTTSPPSSRATSTCCASTAWSRPRPARTLSARQVFQRDRIVAAIEHKRAAGMSTADAVADYLRDAAFTTLNRFVALKMLEARELVQECITKGEQSAGYTEFCGMAPGLRSSRTARLSALHGEPLRRAVDRGEGDIRSARSGVGASGRSVPTFDQALLEILNATELAGVWGEDETIGWVYQYFNGADERKRMREESQAPRNSRELAVRNQFFTPRYVVEFLTDNTLGRIWYEMRGTQTALADKCEYMVRKPGETFVPRAKKDPRDLRVLDPACGSGHFLLYAFDLLLRSTRRLASRRADARPGRSLRRTTRSSTPAAAAPRPRFSFSHNLHGVDIDPRAR